MSACACVRWRLRNQPQLACHGDHLNNTHLRRSGFFGADLAEAAAVGSFAKPHRSKASITEPASTGGVNLIRQLGLAVRRIQRHDIAPSLLAP